MVLKRAADHGRAPEHVDDVGPKAGEAAGDQVLDAVGHTQAPGLGSKAELSVALDEDARVGEMTEQLTNEQRIACGVPAHRGSERPGSATAVKRTDELAHLVVAQAAERDPFEGYLAVEIGRGLDNPFGAWHLGGPVGAQEQQRRLLTGPRDVLEQEQRRCVRPVQVLQHDHQRRGPGPDRSARLTTASNRR